MHDFWFSVFTNVFSASLGAIIAAEVLGRVVREYVQQWWRRLSNTDPYVNLYGRFYCYRLTSHQGLLVYTIDVKRGWGINPTCVWENLRLSVPKRVGTVVKEGSKYALLFQEKANVPFIILLHGEGMSQSKQVKLGFHTARTGMESSSIFSGMIILSRRELTDVEQYLDPTRYISEADYQSVCKTLAQ